MGLRTNFDGMLPELKAVPNWVLAKPSKAPCQPDGRPASVTNPQTWAGFDQVRASFDPRSYIGIGFVIDGKPHFKGKFLHGFDWDHCISNGQIDPAVVARLNQLGIERLEISISGTGLRGFFLHDKLLPSRKTLIDGHSVELYSNLRYLVTTGIALPGKEALE
jgi:primase-polymerase (primpol)-like protein